MTTAAPKARPSKAAPAAPAATHAAPAPQEFHPNNMGRTKGGTGKQEYWTLTARGVRGTIFTDPKIVSVKIVVEYAEDTPEA